MTVEPSSNVLSAKEGFIMDPHFNEYLAAVAGMHETYGEPACDGRSEFHEDQPTELAASEPAAV